MADYETLHVGPYAGYHDANNVSTFGGDPVTKLNLKTRFKKVMRDLQRRSSIGLLLESARDRVTSASKTACDRVTAMERPARKTVQSILYLLILQTCSYAHQCLYNTIKWPYQPQHSPSYYFER